MCLVLAKFTNISIFYYSYYYKVMLVKKVVFF